MWAIHTHVLTLWVCVSVSMLVTRAASPAKTAEPIEMPFGLKQMLSWAVGRRNYVLDCYLANTIERSLLGGDADSRNHYCRVATCFIKKYNVLQLWSGKT